MALSTQTAPELTREQVVSILTQPLEAAATFLAAGPHIFDTDGSPIRIPRAPESVADELQWTGENEQIPEVDAELDELQLLPSTMKSVKVITRYSNELARQSIVSLDAALKDRLVRDVATKLDTQFWGAAGDGVTTPKGLLAYTAAADGIQEVDAAGPMTLDVVLDAWAKALGGSVDMSKLRWGMTSADFVALRKLKGTDNRYLLTPDPTVDGVFRLFGAPVTITDRLSDTDGAGNAVLADFSQIAVARDLAPSVKVLTERYADYDQQAIRTVARYDSGLLNPAAVVKVTGIAR